MAAGIGGDSTCCLQETKWEHGVTLRELPLRQWPLVALRWGGRWPQRKGEVKEGGPLGCRAHGCQVFTVPSTHFCVFRVKIPLGDGKEIKQRMPKTRAMCLPRVQDARKADGQEERGHRPARLRHHVLVNAGNEKCGIHSLNEAIKVTSFSYYLTQICF